MAFGNIELDDLIPTCSIKVLKFLVSETENIWIGLMNLS